MPLFVVAAMAQLVLCDGIVPVTGRFGLDPLSWLTVFFACFVRLKIRLRR